MNENRVATDPVTDILPIAVRVFGFPDGAQLRGAGLKNYGRGPSEWNLVVYVEATADPAQRFRFGTYQIRERDILREIGLFHDPDALSPDELRVLRDFAAARRLKLLTLAEFVYGVLVRVGYPWQGTTIGHDLPFTLSRLATDHGLTRGRMRPGFTLDMRPDGRSGAHIAIKHVSRRFSLMSWSGPGQKLPRGMRKRAVAGPRRRPAFVDVRTLGSALLAQLLPLGALAHTLGTPHQRRASDEFGKPLTAEALDNAVLDAQVIWECFVELRRRLSLHGLTKLPIDKVFSGASIAKGYLREMGVRPLLEVQPDFPPELLGKIMESYSGGRTEARLRRQVVQVLYCDFTSQYPTVCTLMGLSRFVTATRVTWNDATAKARAIIERTDLAEFPRPEAWPDLTMIVQIKPQGDLLPVRTRYGRDMQRTIGDNHLVASPRPIWCTLADCVASKLKTGNAPEIIKAIAFAPRSQQSGLKPVWIAGNPAFEVDPAKEDVFRRMIEFRAQTTGEERDAIKTIAVSMSYGIPMQINIQEKDEPVAIRCYPGSGPQFLKDMDRVEEPGEYFNPLLATLIAGAGRLLLAIAERLVLDAGLTWAFCDTDSMAIAKPEAMSEAEFYNKAEGVRRWFDALNPYRGVRELFKAEDENYPIDGDRSRGFERLWCYVISSKRYALFNVDTAGQIVIRKASAHGLGHLVPPYGDNEAPPDLPRPVVPLEELGIPRWQHDFWHCILRAAWAGQARPDFSRLPNFDKPAVIRYGANTPHLLGAFDGFNEGWPPAERVGPFNQVLMFLADRDLTEEDWLADDEDDPIEAKRARDKAPGLPHVIAPYRPDPADAAKECVDRDTGDPVPLNRLKTYASVLAVYPIHPESKFLNASYLDSGQTERRRVQASAIFYIGKEANRWEEQAVIGYDPDQEVEFGMSPDEGGDILRAVHEAAEQYGQRAVAAISGVSLQQLSAILVGRAKPKEATLVRLARGVLILARADDAKRSHARDALSRARLVVAEIGLRPFARVAKVDPGNLARLLSGERDPSPDALSKIDKACTMFDRASTAANPL